MKRIQRICRVVALPLALPLAFLIARPAAAEGTVSLEIATQQGTQITAPQRWLQLLTELGVTSVRIRGARSGEEPSLEKLGSGEQPIYRVVGMLDRRDRLVLPGGAFGQSDRQKLKDYFADLSADGAEGVTAPKGMFDLTEKQFLAVVDDLSRPLAIPTKGLAPADVLKEAAARLKTPVHITPEATRALRDAGALSMELREFTAGTALAVVARSAGLEVVPEKLRGEAVRLAVSPIDAERLAWPIGWEPETRLSAVAPKLLEYINVEIDGFTIQEAIDAIAPRLEVAVFWDNWAIEKKGVDLQTPVTMPRTNTFYNRILQHLLSQAKLVGVVRIDEAGKGFFWISSERLKNARR